MRASPGGARTSPQGLRRSPHRDGSASGRPRRRGGRRRRSRPTRRRRRPHQTGSGAEDQTLRCLGCDGEGAAPRLIHGPVRPGQHDTLAGGGAERAVAQPSGPVLPDPMSDEVLPGEHEADGQRVRARVHRGPLEHADRVAALAVVAGNDRRQLTLGQPYPEVRPVIGEPRIREERVIRAGPFRKVPTPRSQGAGSDRAQDVRSRSRSAGGVDRELAGGDRLEVMAPRVQVPPREVPARRATDAPGPQAAERHAAPRPVVDDGLVGHARAAGLGCRDTDGPAPGSTRDAMRGGREPRSAHEPPLDSRTTSSVANTA